MFTTWPTGRYDFARRPTRASHAPKHSKDGREQSYHGKTRRFIRGEEMRDKKKVRVYFEHT